MQDSSPQHDTGGIATLERPESTEMPTNLRPVMQAIPAECYENPTWRGIAYVARDFVLYALVLWGLFVTDNPLLLVPLWAAAGLVVSGLFVLGHDAAHEALFKHKWLNGAIGRITMLPSLHVYEAWVLGHNRVHHGHTVKEGVDFVWHPLTAEQFAALSPMKKLRHRLEWSWAGSGFYYMRDVWWNKMISFAPPARWRRKIIVDRVGLLAAASAAVAVLGTVGWMRYGTVVGAIWMVVKLAVIPFLLFNHIIGLTVHVHHIDPDIKWYRRKDWNKFKAQVEGTTVLHARRWANVVIHNIFVHVPHHVDMRIPFYHLPRAAEAIEGAFPGAIVERRLRLRDHVRNTQACKLYDFDEHRWLTYEEAQQKLSVTSAA